jgi:hypothetical protein
MAEVEVRSGRVKAQLDSKRPAGGKFLGKLLLGVDVGAAA